MSWDSPDSEIRVREIQRELEELRELIQTNQTAGNVDTNVGLEGTGLGSNTPVIGPVNYPFVYNPVDHRRFDTEPPPGGGGNVFNTIFIRGTAVTVTPKGAEDPIQIRTFADAIHNGQIMYITVTDNGATLDILAPLTTEGNIDIGTDITGLTTSNVLIFQWRTTATTATSPSGAWVLIGSVGGGGSGTTTDMWKQPCRVATTVNYSNLSLVGENIDGSIVVVGDRVLVHNQTTGSENGIYVVDSVIATIAALVRASDFNENAEVKSGATVYIEEGTFHQHAVYKLLTTNPITLDTTALVFGTLTNMVGENIEDVDKIEFNLTGTMTLASTDDVTLEYEAPNTGAHDFYVDRPSTTIPRFGIQETQLQSNVPLFMQNTGSVGDSGRIRFPNDNILLSARNNTDDGNLEIKATTQDEFDFTESANNDVKFLLRSQHATEADQIFLLQQNSGTGGLATITAPNNMTLLSNTSTANMLLSTGSVLFGTDIHMTNNDIMLDSDNDSGITSLGDDVVQIFINNVVSTAFQDDIITTATDILQTQTATINLHDLNRPETLADNTDIGEIRFRAFDGLGVTNNYAKIIGVMGDDVNGDEDGILEFYVARAGNHNDLMFTLTGSTRVAKLSADLDIDTFDFFNADRFLFQSGTAAGLTSVDTGFGHITGGGIETNVLAGQDWIMSEDGVERFRMDGGANSITITNSLFSVLETVGSTSFSIAKFNGNTDLSDPTEIDLQVAGLDIVRVLSTGITMADNKFIANLDQLGFRNLGNLIEDDVNGMIFTVIPTDDFTWDDGTTTFATLDVNSLNLNDLHILVQDIAVPTVPGAITQGQIFFNQADNRLSFQRRNDGDTAWITVDLEAGGGGGGATIELDNLGTTAINADLNLASVNIIPSTDLASNLGDTTHAFSNVYFRTLTFDTAGKTIAESGANVVHTVPTSSDIIFQEVSTQWFRCDGGTNTTIFNRPLTMENTILMNDNLINWNASGYDHDITPTTTELKFGVGGATDSFKIQWGGDILKQFILFENDFRSSSDATVSNFQMTYRPTTPTVPFVYGAMDFNYRNSVGTIETHARIEFEATDITNGFEEGDMVFYVFRNGNSTLAEVMRFDGSGRDIDIGPGMDIVFDSGGMFACDEITFITGGGAGMDLNQGDIIDCGDCEIDGDLNHDGAGVGFYGTTPIAKQTSVGVDASSIHAALVALGLIT